MRVTFVYIYSILLLLWGSNLNAQVTIGSDLKPSDGSLLDLKEFIDVQSINNSTKGLLLPRVSLERIDELYPMFKNSNDYNTNPTEKERLKKEHAGLVVYNLNQCLGQAIMIWDGQKWSNMNDPKFVALALPNSYTVIATPQTIKIPVEKAYAIWEHYGSDKGHNRLPANVDLTGELSVEILWQEGVYTKANEVIAGIPQVTQGRKGYITLNTTGNAGNAVVALKIGGTIRWSWHIWVTENEIKEIKFKSTIGLGQTFMDRNLGATTYAVNGLGVIGLHYQWGRKDPFPGYRTLLGVKTDVNVDVKDVSASPQDNIVTAITSPLTFLSYKQKDTQLSLDWYNSAKNIADSQQAAIERWDDRWSEDVCSGKSPFDPCPQGWRVPNGKFTNDAYRSPWHDAPWDFFLVGSISANNGVDWSGQAGYWPFTSYRGYDGVVADSVYGKSGYYWSRDVAPKQSFQTFLMYFAGSTLYNNSAKEKVNGYAVRCIKE